ncbi:hypothetical protein HID58_086936, partial [Brassica napus]
QQNRNDQFVNIFYSFSSNLYSWCAYKMLVWRGHNHMSEKLKEKGDLEIARVAHEMKHKLKIATVAMVVVGAIVGIWTSLS